MKIVRSMLALLFSFITLTSCESKDKEEEQKAIIFCADSSPSSLCKENTTSMYDNVNTSNTTPNTKLKDFLVTHYIIQVDTCLVQTYEYGSSHTHYIVVYRG